MVTQFCLLSDGAGAEEGGGEDEQRGARGHGQVPPAVGTHPAPALHQVPRYRHHHHPRREL